jgi:hypothetical protein
LLLTGQVGDAHAADAVIVAAAARVRNHIVCNLYGQCVLANAFAQRQRAVGRAKRLGIGRRRYDCIDHIGIRAAQEIARVLAVGQLPDSQLGAVEILSNQIVGHNMTNRRANGVRRVVRKSQLAAGKRQPAIETKTGDRNFNGCVRREPDDHRHPFCGFGRERHGSFTYARSKRGNGHGDHQDYTAKIRNPSTVGNHAWFLSSETTTATILTGGGILLSDSIVPCVSCVNSLLAQALTSPVGRTLGS